MFLSKLNFIEIKIFIYLFKDKINIKINIIIPHLQIIISHLKRFK